MNRQNNASGAACFLARLGNWRMLSDRELEVCRVIGQGVKTQEIAARLYLSIKTIETYRVRIREKLELKGGVELARCAVQWVLERV